MAATFKIKGMKALQFATSPAKMTPLVKKHIERANQLNGTIAVSEIRRGINAGGFEKNKPLTVAIKKDDKPLIGRTQGGAGGQLFQAVTWKQLNRSTIFVGVLKVSRFYNIAYFLHEGGQIGVTERMRALFFYLWLASIGSLEPSKLTGRAKALWKMMPGDWKPLKPGTKAITVPKRPFISRVFGSRTFVAGVKKNWELALAAAIKEGSKKGGKS